MPKLSEVMGQPPAQPKRLRLSDVMREEKPLEIDIVGGRREGEELPPEQPAQPKERDRSWWDSLGRDVAMGVRSSMQGAGSLIGGIGGDAFNHYLLPGEQPTFRDAAAGLADRMGLPKPETGRERILSGVGEALTGTGLTLGMGGALNAGRSAISSGAPTFTNRLADFLTGQPKLQAAATTTAASAQEGVKEAGGGELLQAGAGLTAALLPGSLTAAASIPARSTVQNQSSLYAAAKGATRRLLRGRDSASDSKTQGVRNALADFRTAGATPSMGQATGDRIPQAMETAVGNMPGGAGRIAKFADRQSAGVKSNIDRLMSDLTERGATVDAQQVGQKIREGVVGAAPESFVPRTRAVVDRLYKRVDDAIPAGTRVEVGRTRQALADLNSTIEGAPNVSKFFQNARIQGIEGALTKDTSGVAGALARPEIRQQADGLRAQLQDEAQQAATAVQGYADQIRAQLRAQADQIAQENQRLASVGLRQSLKPVPTARQIEEVVQSRISALPKPMSKAEIDQQVDSWLSGQVDDRLPYEALKKLRTLVGNEIDNYSLVDNVPRSKWKALYGALSEDMKAVAQDAGASDYWRRADRYYKMRGDRLEQIDHVINANGGPEYVYNAAVRGTNNGATTLHRVMTALPKESQRELTAAFVRRMGRARDSAQNADVDQFSMETFLTNWAKLSDPAKNILFNRHGLDFKDNMNAIARAADRVRSASSVFYNSSGSARQISLISLFSALGTAGTTMLSGNVSAGMKTLGAIGATAAASNGIARIFTNPNAVRWLAKNTERPTGEIVAQLNALRRVAEKEDDSELVEAVDAVRQAAEQSGQLHPLRN